MVEKQSTTTSNEEGVLSRSITGGTWLSVGYVLQKAIGFLSFIILARILSPADFGVIALVLLVPKTLQSISETGFSQAAVQKGGDIKKYLDPIWTIGILKSFTILILVFLFGPMIAVYFGVPDATLAIRLGGLFVFIQNLSNIGEIYFVKDLDFKKFFFRNISREIVYLAAVLTIVYFIPSYWALVIATLVSYITLALSTYILHPYRPRLSFDFLRLKDLFGYSKWIIGQGWIVQAYAFLEQTIVARLTGISSFGLFTKAKSVSGVVPGFLSPILSLIGFSAYSKLKDDPEKIRRGFLQSLNLLFFFLIPSTLLVIFAGGKLILIFLGEQWLPMTDAFRFLLCFFLILSVIDLCYSLLNGIGHPAKKVQYDTVRLLVTILLIFVLTPLYGIGGAAAAILFGSIPTFGMALSSLVRLTTVRLHDILQSVFVPLLLSLMVMAPILFYKETFIGFSEIILFLLLALFSVFYLVAIYLFDKFFHIGPFPTLRLIMKHIGIL